MQLMAEPETRIAANAERLHGVSDEHPSAALGSA